MNSEDFLVIQYDIDTGHFKLTTDRGKDKLVYEHSSTHTEQNNFLIG